MILRDTESDMVALAMGLSNTTCEQAAGGGRAELQGAIGAVTLGGDEEPAATRTPRRLANRSFGT
eukprot:861966-Rhodomonas_salina.1